MRAGPTGAGSLPGVLAQRIGACGRCAPQVRIYSVECGILTMLTPVRIIVEVLITAQCCREDLGYADWTGVFIRPGRCGAYNTNSGARRQGEEHR
jgi:hypothetical protein